MNVIEVKHLNKEYPSFLLKDVSFNIEDGKITGFIGRNGAGKSTTIKSMLNLVHPNSGEIYYFGKSLYDYENDIKKLLGYSTGSVIWYPKNKIKDIIKVISGFYDTWDNSSYEKYLDLFELDDKKSVFELSEGMKVKFTILIALSHQSKVLVLDEPTSGLDPFSRDELINLFIKLKKDGITIFFSTHIISDLEKCADNIIYISDGKIIASLSKQLFKNTFSKNDENLEETIIRLEREIKNA